MSDHRHAHFAPDGSERPQKRLVVHWSDLVTGLDGLDPDSDYEIRVRREVIPILLVPGLLGTRLHTREGERVWEPSATLLPSAPNGHGVASMLLRLAGVWTSPQDRARLMVGEGFDPEHLQVPDATTERGLQALAADVYGEALRRLSRWHWSDLVRLCFELPVHGFGYNWTDDNARSGELLAGHLERLLEEYGDSDCRQVILVTHGTGGLVARVACALYGAEEMVLGVFHGAQPALGTPALYHALKSGFSRQAAALPRMAAAALGHTGRHVTALLERMPGPLQALPWESYADSSGDRRWLKFQGPNGAQTASLPDGERSAVGSSEQERYWGLGQTGSPLAATGEFQQRLGHGHHENSYHALGRGLPTAESATFRVAPRGRKKQYGRLKLVPVGQRDADQVLGLAGAHRCVHGEGRFAASLDSPDGVTLEVSLQPPDGDGDGWVPACSARAAAPAEAEPRGRAPRCLEFEGAEHFGFFSHGPVLDYLTTAIEQMCEDLIEEEVG